MRWCVTKYKDALQDFTAFISSVPDIPRSRYLLGVLTRLGKAQEAAMDLAIARQLNPGIDRDYGQFGVKPSDAARALGK
jgi:hypothetical protein